MKKGIGIVCLIGGVVVLAWGRNIAQSLGSQVVQTFTGAPTDRAIQFYVAGTVLVLAGLFCLFTAKK